VAAGPINEIARRLAERDPAAAAVPPAPAAAEGASAETAPAYVTPGGAALPPQARRRLRLRVLGDARAVVPLIAGGGGVLGVEPAPGGQLMVQYAGDERFVADIVRHLVTQGVPVVGVEPERNELERIFLEVTRGDLQ
jgi:ABC-2 type transport system ATP-binding protein